MFITCAELRSVTFQIEYVFCRISFCFYGNRVCTTGSKFVIIIAVAYPFTAVYLLQVRTRVVSTFPYKFHGMGYRIAFNARLRRGGQFFSLKRIACRFTACRICRCRYGNGVVTRTANKPRQVDFRFIRRRCCTADCHVISRCIFNSRPRQGPLRVHF